MAGDVISLLEHDHRTVEGLFEQFRDTSSAQERGRIFDRIATELTAHTAVEERYVYPVARTEVDEGAELIREAEHEHDEAKQLIVQIRAMDPTDPEYPVLVGKLEGAVHHHVEEEESEMFPKLREEESADRLSEMGHQVERAKAAELAEPLPFDGAEGWQAGERARPTHTGWVAEPVPDMTEMQATAGMSGRVAEERAETRMPEQSREQSRSNGSDSSRGARNSRRGVDIDLTKEELYEKAKKAKIKGRSSMTKAELAEALAKQS
jgi:hemerythrin superfamily protein